MPFTIDNANGRLVLTLAGAITIRQARDLAAGFSDRLGEDPPLAVDAGAVDDIDTCILQLLCSLRKTVPALSFIAISDAFVASVDRCGLRRELLGAREGL